MSFFFFFFNVGHLKIFVESVTIMASVVFWVLFFFGSEACWILGPRPGIEPTAPFALESEVLTTGPPEKSPHVIFYMDKKPDPPSRLPIPRSIGNVQCWRQGFSSWSSFLSRISSLVSNHLLNLAQSAEISRLDGVCWLRVCTQEVGIAFGGRVEKPSSGLRLHLRLSSPGLLVDLCRCGSNGHCQTLV